MSVPFLDLRRQYRAISPEIDGAIRDVLEGSQFILGPNVAAFEQELAEFCGATHGIGVASGSDALRLALQAVGVGPGAEVITPSFTFVATAEAIVQLGAIPIFADIDPTTYTLDPDEVRARVTTRTRAVVPVHLYGHPCDMDPLRSLADALGLALIEDAAQAVGAEDRGRRVGSLGDLACFSFFPTKNLGGYGDGGFVTTNDPALADRVLVLREHGSREKYLHEEIGWSSRLDELQAAVLRVKLRHLEAWTERRRGHAAHYRARLAGLPLGLPHERLGARAVYHLFTIRTSDRDGLQKSLDRAGIRTRVYYPLPLHLQRPYRSGKPLPESERASQEVLSLPLYPELEPEELDTVAGAVAAHFASSGP